VNATLLLLLTVPSTPAAIANRLGKVESVTIFQRRSVKQYKEQNHFSSNSFCVVAFNYTNELSCRVHRSEVYWSLSSDRFLINLSQAAHIAN